MQINLKLLHTMEKAPFSIYVCVPAKDIKKTKKKWKEATNTPGSLTMKGPVSQRVPHSLISRPCIPFHISSVTEECLKVLSPSNERQLFQGREVMQRSHAIEFPKSCIRESTQDNLVMSHKKRHMLQPDKNLQFGILVLQSFKHLKLKGLPPYIHASHD